MRTAIYARVSTTDQANTIQVRELKEYVQRRGWEVAGIYEDQMSGAKASRPGLNQLMCDARLRKFDVVVVLKLNRFGRFISPLRWHYSGTASPRDQDRLQQGPAHRTLRLQAGRRPGGREWRPDGLARFPRRAVRECLHAGLPAAEIQP